MFLRKHRSQDTSALQLLDMAKQRLSKAKHLTSQWTGVLYGFVLQVCIWISFVLSGSSGICHMYTCGIGKKMCCRQKGTEQRIILLRNVLQPWFFSISSLVVKKISLGQCFKGRLGMLKVYSAASTASLLSTSANISMSFLAKRLCRTLQESGHRGIKEANMSNTPWHIDSR